MLDSKYARTGSQLYEAVKKQNDAGECLPLWTTCLGFELIFLLEMGSFSFSRCDELDTCSSISFLPDFTQLTLESKMFAGVSRDVYQVS